MIHGPTSHSYISQRQRLHYVDWGNAGAPPLLLVHGARDHCRSWDWVAEELRADWHIIAPDLRGHGDSAWSADGNYGALGYLYDIAQLIHQLHLAPVSIVAHSLGANVCLRYAGLYPDKVRKIAAIEGLRPPPRNTGTDGEETTLERLRAWLEQKRAAAGRLPRRYPTLEDAYARMKTENSYLSDEQARHLTVHGVSQNEDGTFSWKFDNYVNTWSPFDLTDDDLHALWGNITCPTLLLYGTNSWATNPSVDGRIKYFKNAEVVSFEEAGHWLHHDQLDQFVVAVRGFLGPPPTNDPEGGQ